MDVDVRFRVYVEDYKLFTREDKVLVAVSGGRDSMLLLTLLHRYGMELELAHCNFQLRDVESDGDEELVLSYAALLGVKVHVRRFDTTSYAEKHRISIQMAARELRYDWFEKVRKERACKYIAIAQHKNDHIETVLLNLSRGTGLLGMQGILPKRDKILRPLLFLSSAEVLEAVQTLGIPYRDDSSNFSNKYARNKIRLDIIPHFEQLSADFVDIMNDNILRFQESQRVLQYFVEQKRKELLVKIGPDDWEIAKESIRGLDLALLYFLFEPFGFSKNVLADLVQSLDKESGRIFESDRYQLLLDRTVLRLRHNHYEQEVAQLNADQDILVWRNYRFTVSTSPDLSIDRDVSVALLDYDKLVFPLKVRSWQEGDSFQPLGMEGKKKVSDFLIQKKINLFDKRAVPIWLNGNGELIWIANYQIDNRYKITENTQKVLKLVCNISRYEYK